MGKQFFAPAPSIAEDEIQGDVLVGLQKQAEVFVFFEIVDLNDFREALRKLVGDGGIATVRQARTAEQVTTPRTDRVTVNMAFSATGLEKFGCDMAGADPSFVAGMWSQAGALGDQPSDWLPMFAKVRHHGVLIVAASAADKKIASAVALARNKAEAIKALFGASLLEGHREEGKLNKAAAGHEMFGFADGVSQPAVDGLHMVIAADDQSLPGQDLVAPGEFVFGKQYETERLDEHGLKVVATPPATWMENGSYLVFRRLRQDVPLFESFIKNNHARFGLDADTFGARIVGRWKDGTPLARDPLRRDPPFVDPTRKVGAHADGTGYFENNDFEFGVAKVGQSRCPFNAHIRRVYPRSDVQGGDGNAEQKRILRAGIAYDHSPSEAGDVGLLFVCYQTSIVDKFEFIQKSWANQEAIPFVPDYTDPEISNMKPALPGHDLIIGQPVDAAGKAVPRHADWTVKQSVAGVPHDPNDDDFATRQLKDVPAFVKATGGEYFFSPSLHALMSI